ncbi:hypothetical protein [uncultured Maricaulis sp.]|uniref:hypothetical protein n=1 Tax=uncultured Maricaulis sp. TaxID=174710 RepID=UPI0030DAE8E3
MQAPVKRYLVHFGAAMLVYMLLLFGTVSLLNSMELAQWQRGVLAVLPVLPGLYALHAVMVFFHTRDEFKRRIISESMLAAALLTGFACFAYGFIEGAVDLPEISMIWVLPVMVGLAGLISCILRWLYR